MLRLTSAALLLLSLSLTAADEKKPAKAKKPTGTWERVAGNCNVAFKLKEDRLTVEITGGQTITVEADYAVSRDGKWIYAVVTSAKDGGSGHAPKAGEPFSFQFSAAKNELTLSDMRGSTASDEAKKILEGVYGKK